MKLKNIYQYIARSVTIITTALIVLVIVLIIQGILFETARTFTHKRQQPDITKTEAELSQEEKRLNIIRNSAKEFLPDGTIHHVNRLENKPSRRDEPEMLQIYDINDNLLWEGLDNKNPYEYLSWSSRISSRYNSFTQQRLKQIQIITPGFSQDIEILVGSDNQTEQIWRYRPAQGHFVGYDNEGQEIGYLGSTGFTDSESNVKSLGEFKLFTAWIPKDSDVPIFLWQRQKCVFQIDFQKQQVELLLESIDSDITQMELHAWRDLKPDSEDYVNPEKYRPLLLCRTADGKHHLILRNPEQKLTFNAPVSSATATKQGIFLRHRGNDMAPPDKIRYSPNLFGKWYKERLGKPRNLWTELYKVDNRGNLELLNRYDWTITPLPQIFVKGMKTEQIIRNSVVQVSPPLYDYILYIVCRKFWMYTTEWRNSDEFFPIMFYIIQEMHPQQKLTNRILSLIMMAFMFFHGWPRRTTWPKFIFWLFFVGLFNLAGLLTYLALNHTSVIKCSSCGKRRGIKQVGCVRCGAELQAPRQGKLDLILTT